MMQISCPSCHKIAISPLNLRCDHHPCYNCCKKFITMINSKQKIDNISQLETKYQIKCPTCAKKTVTYDVKNLIMNLNKNQVEGEEYFISNQFLQKTIKIDLTKHKNNQIKSSNLKQKQNNFNTTKQLQKSISQSSETHSSIECPNHKSKIKYLCYNCHNSNIKRAHNISCNPLLCDICVKYHDQTHDILTIGQSIDYIWVYNKNQKQKLMSYKLSLKSMSQVLKNKKVQTLQYFTKIEKQLDQQYQQITETLNRKFSELKTFIRSQFTQNVKQFNNSVQLLKSTKLRLQEIQNQQLSSEISNIKGYLKSLQFKFSYDNLNSQLQSSFKPLRFKQMDSIQYLIKQVNDKLSINCEVDQQKSTFQVNEILCEKKSSESNKIRNDSLIKKKLSHQYSNSTDMNYKQDNSQYSTIQIDIKKLHL